MTFEIVNKAFIVSKGTRSWNVFWFSLEFAGVTTQCSCSTDRPRNCPNSETILLVSSILEIHDKTFKMQEN